MCQPLFTRDELVEINDAIAIRITDLLDRSDPDRDETTSGTLTLLHEAQKRLLSACFNISMDETTWGTEQGRRIVQLRRAQALPAHATNQERAAWAASVTLK